MTPNFLFYSVKVLTELFWDIVKFPLWWYSRGLLNLVLKLKTFLGGKEKSLALSVWIKNIFRPMYGQNDIAGFIISFLMRFVQIIFRGIAMLFWVLFSLLVILFWIAFPLFILYQISLQLYA